MRIAKLFILTAASALSSLILCGCDNDGCDGNRSALPLAGFYSSFSPLESVAPPGLTVAGVGAPGDSLLLDNTSGVTQCYLPFRIDSGSTTFTFVSRPDPATTLRSDVTFEYDIEPFFVSSDCGAVYNFRITSVSTDGNLIDSVVCPDKTITNADIENLRIYFHQYPQSM